jgi:Amt family ammonium transporter
MKRFWLIPLTLIALLAVLGIVYPVTSSEPGAAAQAGDIAWLLMASAMVLLMTPGLSFFYGGMVQKKNVISTMLQSFISLGVISLIWVLVGFSLSFGDSIGGIIGNPASFFMMGGVGADTHTRIGSTIPLVLFAFFQLKFAIITPGLITGSFAERVRFSAYLLFIVLFSLFIYSPLAHMTWHPDGLLFSLGVLDFAGGTVVHMSAGFAALAGAIYLGPRKVNLGEGTHTPANIPFVILGTGLLWFGWFGFNAGSALGANGTAAMAFATTNIAAAAAMLVWGFMDAAMGKKVSALGCSIGAVVGLVAITPAAGFVSIGSSIFIGAVASAISNLAVHFKSKTSLDDTLDVFACHGLGGAVGMVMTGIFATSGGLITGETKLFFTHLLAMVGVGIFSFAGGWILFKITDLIIPIRVPEEQEQIGLDLSQHGETISSKLKAVS